MTPPHVALLRIHWSRMLAVAVLACALIAGVAWSFAGAGGGQASSSLWLVLASNRDGFGDVDLGVDRRAYAVRPDGSGLTDLLGKRRTLNPIAVSADGSAIAYGAGEFPTSIYVSRADGTDLRRAVHAKGGRTIDAAVLSPDGEELAYTSIEPDRHHRLFVVGADGRHRRDLGAGAAPDWSADGKKLVFVTGKGCGVAVEPFGSGRLGHVPGKCGSPKWSPDGKSIAYEAKGGCAVTTNPPTESGLGARLDQILEGGGRVLLPGTCESPEWSSDGRWIAYSASGCPYCDSEAARQAALKHVGVWVVRPDGRDRRRVGPADEEEGATFSWSPDGTRLAFTEGSKIFVVGLAGHPKRLRLGVSASYDSFSPPLWSPDGMRITLVAQAGDDPDQLWSVRPDGSGLRRLTSSGANDLVGWGRMAPARPTGAPLPPSERVLGPRTLETGSPIGLLSADGGRVAYTAGTTRTDCEHASIWTPAKETILRVSRRLPAPCEEGGTVNYTVYELALAGSFIGWSETVGCGNSCDVQFLTAALPEASPVLSGDDEGGGGGADGGELTQFGPLGHGNVFIFDNAVRVATRDGQARGCKLRRKGYAESVDGSLIAVEEADGIAVLDDRCSLVNVLPFGKDEVSTALLDGRRLVVSRLGLLESYDVGSGALLSRRPLPSGYVLRDAAGGIALLRHGRSILLSRLGDGRTITFAPCRGPVLADIEAAGLYYTRTTLERGGRLVFVPRAELERRLASGTNSEPPCLRSAESYKTGRGPVSVAAGDLNHDGRADLVTANEDGRVSVLLNAGNGAFQARHDYRTGGSPSSVTIGDLNADGRSDLAVADNDSSTVAVLLNRGDGTFLPKVDYRAGRSPSLVAIADVDGNGTPDLVVGHSDNGRVSVLLGQGDGRFAAKVDYPVGDDQSTLVAVGDVDQDGKPDLVVTRPFDNVVSVFRNRGDGTFGRGHSYRVGTEPSSVAIADLNGDGNRDLVVRSHCRVSVLFGRGHGTFGAARAVPRPEDCAQSLAVGDLNGDGKPEVVTVGETYPYPSTLSVFLNRGDGSFGSSRSYETVGVQPGPAAIADLNGDGRPDLVSSNYDRSSVSVLLNTLGVCRVGHLEGKTLAATRATLTRFHCRVAKVSREYSKRVEKGRVIAPEPRFGAFWPNGPEVDLVVSLGRRG